MEKDVGLIGFGEAGCAFAMAGGWAARARVYDRKTDQLADRAAKLADYRTAGVDGRDDGAAVVGSCALILSLVTADQALAAAKAAATAIRPGAIFCDMNSVAPDTKRAASAHITCARGRYVDIAVMAPVDPAGLDVPLLLSGAHADAAMAQLRALGFTRLRVVGDEIGRASAIKMIRSVMVKGIEALTAECLLAAGAAGVTDEVLASLDAIEPPRSWTERADYHLDRMMVHGLRRAAEMEEVIRTLDGLGTGSAMTRGTVARQRAIGALGMAAPATGVGAKLDQLRHRKAQAV